MGCNEVIYHTAVTGCIENSTLPYFIQAKNITVTYVTSRAQEEATLRVEWATT